MPIRILFSRAVVTLLGVAMATFGSIAKAQPGAPQKDLGESTSEELEESLRNEDEIPVLIERRGGFSLGVIVGPTLGWATGNPSSAAQRNDPAFERSTGLGMGYRVTPYVGGTLTDWFTFGLGASLGRFSNADYASGFWTFVFHLEAYPLYGSGGVFRDLGMTADFGAGTSSIWEKKVEETVADSGVMSTVGVGVFWEPLRVWHMAGGPFLGYQRNWSRWYDRSDVLLGLRVMFYSDQP